jgi:hypothetical protein
MLQDFKIVKLTVLTTNKNKKQQRVGSEHYDMWATGEHVVLLCHVCHEQGGAHHLDGLRYLEHPTPIYSYCLWSCMHHRWLIIHGN